jgi:hypothetical protein
MVRFLLGLLRLVGVGALSVDLFHCNFELSLGRVELSGHCQESWSMDSERGMAEGRVLGERKGKGKGEEGG